MRRTPARPLLVAAALALGLALLGSAGAADPPTDAEFKALVDQDTKVIAGAADAVEKAAGKEKRVVERNAGNGIKSSALMMAELANSRIGGRDAAADAHAAAVRDEALKIYKAADGKKFKEAGEMAKGLAAVKPAADAKKIDIFKEAGELTPKETMHNLTKTSQFGTNAEADIIANAKKATAKPADAALIAHRVLVLGEISKTVKKGENAAEKKAWDDYNAQMIKAAEDLLATTKKKATAADLTKAFNTLNSRCTACHDDDKVGK
jgi:hypothetical protein